MTAIKFTACCSECESMLAITVWPDEMGGADDYEVVTEKSRRPQPGEREAC